MHDLYSLVDDIKKTLEDRGVAQGTRSNQSSTPKVEKKSEGSREGRSMQQVINFSSPSFPA